MFRPKETSGSTRNQILASLALALVAWFSSDAAASSSALAGGIYVTLSSLLSAWIVGFGVRNKSPSAFLLLLLVAEMAKLFFVVIALILTWRCFKEVSWLWEIMGCIAAFAAYGLTLLINSRRR
jgi:F0F1-type ATP synthase assembly protein I